jgi:hypothetical protein
MREETIFVSALEKTNPAQRAAFLDEACGGDEALRLRVELLLEADDRTAGIVERGPDAGPTDAGEPDGPPLLPERVFAGRFKLRQKLGGRLSPSQTPRFHDAGRIGRASNPHPENQQRLARSMMAVLT